MARVERLVEQLCRWLALIGGLSMLLVVVMTLASIMGRIGGRLGLPFSVIGGEAQLTELGIGFAIFCALPWTTLKLGHVRVDLLEPWFGVVLNRVLELLGQLALSILALLVAWRLGVGLFEKMARGETLFILDWPLWWGYAAAQPGAWLFVAASLVRLVASALALDTRQVA